MVLEHLFPENWLENKIGYALLLGALYSLVGITLAKMLFGSNSGLASVMFVSLLLIPSLNKLFAKEERQEEQEKRFTLKKLYQDNKHLAQAYLGVFIGVFLTYLVMGLIGQSIGWDVQALFREQVFLDPVISGRATYGLSTFTSILANNWWVLLACFLLSLISGNGATFFIVWNASAWGVIFGLRAVGAGVVLGQSPIIIASVMLLIVLPHVILEGGAYILAGIAGAVISDDAIRKASSLGRFIGIFAAAIIGFWALNQAFKLVTGGITLLILQVLLALGLIRLLKHSFSDKRHAEVFTYNYYLFIAALAVFIIGAIVETLVLTHSGLLARYYEAAFRFFL